MSGLLQIVYLLVAVYTTTTLSEEISSVSIDNDVISQGSDVTIKCHISGATIGTMVHWFKRQDDSEIQMGTNNIINDIFFNTGRYFSSVQEGDDPAFVIQIRGAQAEDSGEIGCSIPRSGQDVTYVSLHVVVPVEEIKFESMEADGTVIYEYTDGMVVPFNDGDEYHFRCSASGSHPAPQIKMTLGDDDITEYFETINSYEVTGGEPGLEHIHYSSVATTHTPVHVATYVNALDFRCTASVPHTDDVSIGIIPSLKFAPTLDCPETVREDMLAKDVQLICILKANPFSKFESVHWFLKDGSNVTLTADNPRSGHYQFKILPGKTADEKELKLVIDRTHWQVFRDYTFIARNDLGTVSSTVTLETDDMGKSTGGAGEQQISFISFSISILLALAYLIG